MGASSMRHLEGDRRRYVERKTRQGRWRRYAKDPAFRYAAVLAIAFAVPGALVERYVLPAVAHLALAMWRGLGPLGLLGFVLGLIWLADVRVWGVENAVKNRGARNPFWVFVYGLGGWLFVLVESIAIPLARLVELASDALSDRRARRVAKRRLAGQVQLGQAA